MIPRILGRNLRKTNVQQYRSISGMNKVVNSADDAVKDISNGSKILVGGFVFFHYKF